MTTIPVDVACWQDKLAMAPDPEYREAFRSVRLSAMYLDGLLTLSPEDGGHELQRHMRSRQSERHSLFYEWKKRELLHDGPWPPRFCWHTIEIDVADDGTLTWLLPPIYDLPWPTPWGNSCHLNRELAMYELPTRIRAALNARIDPKTLVPHIPDWVRNVLTADEWMTSMRGEYPCT